MDRRIKLIWDFKGPNGSQTAQHHKKHLVDYIKAEKLTGNSTGYQDLTEMHSIAFMVVAEKDMLTFRDALRPHRAEVWTAPSKE